VYSTGYREQLIKTHRGHYARTEHYNKLQGHVTRTPGFSLRLNAENIYNTGKVNIIITPGEMYKGQSLTVFTHGEHI